MDIEERVPSSIELGLEEREISSKELGDLTADSTIGWIDLGTGTSTEEAITEDPFRDYVDTAKSAMTAQWPVMVKQAVKAGWMSRYRGNQVIAQANALVAPTPARLSKNQTSSIAKMTGQTDPSWNDQSWTAQTGSRQLTIEDLYTTLDFVPHPANVRMEVYEQTMFQENHLSALCVYRVANGTTKRGWEYARFDTTNVDDQADEKDKGEIDSLTEWFDNINSISNLRQITEHIAAAFITCSNAFVEVIREELHDQTSLPAGIETTITSTMRVLRGHRGFVQWLAGRFVWFNPYMPRVEDRNNGVRLYEEYWQQKGVDPTSDEFVNSPWARTLNSQMPEGVFNPHLTEIVHLKDLSLSSKYYGFPADYRLGKLHAMLQWALDYNVSMLKNNRIPPFVLLYHGHLSTAAQEDIQQYFNSFKGASNYGKVPIIQAPPGGGSPQAGSVRAGLEIAKIKDEDKDGLFSELITLIRKETAAHYGIPIDLLTTENSNRSTIEIAELLFNDHVINRLHTVLEEMWKQITKYDLGYVNRYLSYINLDTDDELIKAQIAEIWHNIGGENPNEQREKYLQRGPRPGGDEYFEASSASFQAEDLASEEAATATAAELSKNPAKLKKYIQDQQAAAQTPAAGQTGPGASPDAKPAVKQELDAWEYLLEKYGD